MLRRHGRFEVSVPPWSGFKITKLMIDVEGREKQWQEELEKRKQKEPEYRSHHDGDRRRRDGDDNLNGNGNGDDERTPQALLDQKPAVPGIDPRDLTNPIAAPMMPGGIPVPDIKLEHHDVEHANYSTNV